MENNHHAGNQERKGIFFLSWFTRPATQGITLFMILVITVTQDLVTSYWSGGN